MNKEPVLVVMAAGIGSRYGAGVKQLARVGAAGELLLDYSVFDAKRAGFRKIIFIIRKDIEADFREMIGNRVEKYIQVEYAFQDGDDLPEGFVRPAGRTKPWGTGHAVLAARDLIDGPFAVINADDYYGKEAYVKMYEYLKMQGTSEKCCGMVGFILGNTLSENGTVTRGICLVNEEGRLTGVHETKEIFRGPDGRVTGKYAGEVTEQDENALASMNFWGFSEDFIGILKEGFLRFLRELPEGDLKSEYLLPILVDDLIREQDLRVDVMNSPDTWFGITYAEDKAYVAGRIADYTKLGLYPAPLWE